MNEGHLNNPVTRDKYDAVLCDLDGVITNTAKMHATCWKTMFDEYLQKRSAKTREQFRPFDIVSDYTLHVDGKPRFDGVRDFLLSRGIRLPEGTPDDPPRKETVCGLGNHKNELIGAFLETQVVEVYEGTLAFLRHVRDQGIKTAVVTSSQNGKAVLKAVGIGNLFEATVDGHTIVHQQMAGKPAPDSFLKAAEILGVQPTRAVVVEDAISGVQAGARGGFGLVIGVARKGNAVELQKHGAHIVVNDLGDFRNE
ncbi:MAG: hypothetical protein NPIRA06_15570 [Nitrospirales bacterium]|nr:MAG: hypothetical protein NPIRA06_15570 [Nitrospirales bacterium]